VLCCTVLDVFSHPTHLPAAAPVRDTTHMSQEKYIYEKRCIYMKRVIHVKRDHRDMTSIHMKRVIHVKRDVCVCQKRCIYMKRDLLQRPTDSWSRVFIGIQNIYCVSLQETYRLHLGRTHIPKETSLYCNRDKQTFNPKKPVDSLRIQPMACTEVADMQQQRLT